MEFLSNSIKSGKFPQSWWVERKLFPYIHHQRKLVNNGCQAGLPKTEFLLEPVITSLIRDFLKLQSRKIDFVLCTFYLWQVPLLKGKKEKRKKRKWSIFGPQRTCQENLVVFSFSKSVISFVERKSAFLKEERAFYMKKALTKASYLPCNSSIFSVN